MLELYYRVTQSRTSQRLFLMHTTLWVNTCSPKGTLESYSTKTIQSFTQTLCEAIRAHPNSTASENPRLFRIAMATVFEKRRLSLNRPCAQSRCQLWYTVDYAYAYAFPTWCSAYRAEPQSTGPDLFLLSMVLWGREQGQHIIGMGWWCEKYISKEQDMPVLNRMSRWF